MDGRIRRRSMEHLELYDLDKLILLSSNHQLPPPPPPPLPPPRKYRRRLPASQAFERYSFLCDRQRHNTDPIYAATPMFTTISQSTSVKGPRRLLGTRLPSNIIKSVSSTSSKPLKSENTEENGDTKKEESSDDDDNRPNAIDDNSNKSDNDNDNDNDGRNSSRSSDDDGIDDIIDNDDDKFDDDDNKQGIVELMFNGDKKMS
ncbi:unnamed protein product [Rotaria sp. Silwood1]|nr:unnamed protein product [Rotaria sp. Silwood1]CAF3731909.1 unnamed protein product [Rotaria sp. Silwood1]CAF3799525.1 unnamed protein product [Rotaria sp. Silwood1]CAF4592166.1 unnamed protein product [Rotaria sp. Silwood1]CAF4618938.1 unnamed protein product [Rotaria sp. Silwood1]